MLWSRRNGSGIRSPASRSPSCARAGWSWPKDTGWPTSSGRCLPSRIRSKRSEAFAALEPSAASAFYRSLGPLGSLRLIERTGEASRRTYRFLAAFESTRWIQSFVLAEGDGVEELALEPV